MLHNLLELLGRAPFLDSLLTRGHPPFRPHTLNSPGDEVFSTDRTQPQPSSNPGSRRTCSQQRDSISQSPVYAACAEHASESSDTTSSNTLQERSMELKIELLSLPDGDKGSHFPFMKLPVGKSTVADAASIISGLIS